MMSIDLVFHPSRVSPCLGSWAFQLSHDFSVMEICSKRASLSSGISVSIEPRLFSHGNSCRFSAFTAIDKVMIFTRFVNYSNNAK